MYNKAALKYLHRKGKNIKYEYLTDVMLSIETEDQLNTFLDWSMRVNPYSINVFHNPDTIRERIKRYTGRDLK